jgi:beta-lactam-binding protein with PASTA domain
VLWHIVRQDPPAGTPVARGAEVQLTSTSGRALLLYTVPGLLENLASRNR